MVTRVVSAGGSVGAMKTDSPGLYAGANPLVLAGVPATVRLPRVFVSNGSSRGTTNAPFASVGLWLETTPGVPEKSNSPVAHTTAFRTARPDESRTNPVTRPRDLTGLPGLESWSADVDRSHAAMTQVAIRTRDRPSMWFRSLHDLLNGLTARARHKAKRTKRHMPPGRGLGEAITSNPS